MKNRKLAPFIALLLAAILGLVFVVSAYTKTMPISYFEYVVDSQFHLGFLFSAVAARLLIGLEAAIGLLLIFQLWGRKKWVPKMGLLLTIIFSIHLIVLWATVGNDVNCGCMGNQFYLTPVNSLLKNLAIIIGFIAMLLLIKNKNGTSLQFDVEGEQSEATKQQPNYSWITLLVTIVLLIVPFVLFPITEKSTLPVSKLAQANDLPSTSYYSGKGKQIIAFMSLGCGHCRDAAEIFKGIKERNSQLPIHLFFSKGNDSISTEKLENFMEDTGARNLEYSFIPKEDFIYFMQATKNNGVPIILWMQDSTVYRQVSVVEINEKELQLWMQQ